MTSIRNRFGESIFITVFIQLVRRIRFWAALIFGRNDILHAIRHILLFSKFSFLSLNLKKKLCLRRVKWFKIQIKINVFCNSNLFFLTVEPVPVQQKRSSAFFPFGPHAAYSSLSPLTRKRRNASLFLWVSFSYEKKNENGFFFLLFIFSFFVRRRRRLPDLRSRFSLNLTRKSLDDFYIRTFLYLLS